MDLDQDFIQKLTEQRAKRPLKIPRNLSQAILNDRDKLKAVCVYLELKPLYYNGQIENARQRADELAWFLYLSRRKYYYIMRRLVKMGLATIDQDGTLYLASWKKFFALYGIQRPGRFRFYRLKNDYCKAVEVLIRRFALEENLKQQEYQVEHKIFESEIKAHRQQPFIKSLMQVQKANIPKEGKERISQDLIRQIEVIQRADFSNEHSLKNKYKKKGLLAEYYKAHERAYYQNLRKFDHIHTVNFDISISCEKTAFLYGLKSKSGGHYWQQKLQSLNLLVLEKRAVLLDKEDSSIARLIWAIKDESLQLHQFAGTSGIWKRLNNRFHFPNIWYI